MKEGIGKKDVTIYGNCLTGRGREYQKNDTGFIPADMHFTGEM
mgnify:CR=1 FL=1